MQNLILVVNEEPYCLWEDDIVKRNIEFLEGLDVGYFDYALKLYLQAEDVKRSSVALRMLLYHSMETLFSLLGAYIQAPNCVYAWMAKCSNANLRDLLEKISFRSDSLFTKLRMKKVSWENISKLVYHSYMPGTKKNEDTQKQFAGLWKRLSCDFVKQDNIDQYNSIKHGLRVRSGGFGISIGIESENGVSPPDKEMKLIGTSEFGATFFKVKTFGNNKKNRSIGSERVSVNWTIEEVALLTQLVYMSINNVVSALKMQNGIESKNCKFIRPQDDEDFNKPWKYSPTVNNCKINFIKGHDIPHITKKDLIDKLEIKKRK